MSKSFARLAVGAAKLATAPLGRWRAAMALADASWQLQPVWTAKTSAGPIRFLGHSRRCLQDANGFQRDEPETVAWIEGMPTDAVFWDVGANVGFCAIFAARRGVRRVLAFEPAAGTLAALLANVRLNAVEDAVAAYGAALADRTRLDVLHMAGSRTEPGHAMQSFGTTMTVQGEIADASRQAALGFSIDDFVRIFDAPPPTHVKIDVDGIEPAILAGGARTFAAHTREIMVEIDPHSAQNDRDIRSALAAIGFVERATINPQGRNKWFARP